MLSFELDRERIKDLIAIMAKKYKLSSDDLLDLQVMIDNVSSIEAENSTPKSSSKTLKKGAKIFSTMAFG